MLDCKGGADSRRIADRARRVLRGAGATSTAIWPDEASLSLWALPPRQLVSTLVNMVESGTGAAAYYADVLEEIVRLAVDAPGGPPASTADFLARLDANWLAVAYAGAPDNASAGLLRSSAGHVSDVALRYRALLRRLGAGLDGPGGFGDADAWYCILEGTAEIAVAEAQARALVDLLAWFAADGTVGAGAAGAGTAGAGTAGAGTAGTRRDILLAVDEFSAVSRRLPIWQLYERARSLGLAVQVSAQSWPGLAADEDERYRVATTADGGIWLLRTPHPEPVAALAGLRRVVDTARRLLGVPLWAQRGWAHEGLSRAEGTPVVDPEIIRGLDVGQAAYIYRGGVTYVQVKRLVAGPAELAGSGRRIAGRSRCRRAGQRHPGRGAPRAGRRAGRRPAGRAQRPAGPGVRGGTVSGLAGGTDPFATLGLPPRTDLTDDDVRAAWRRIAAATHPDRADGGDPGRFAVAAAAYTVLRTRSGRGEALADLASPSPALAPGRPRAAGALVPAAGRPGWEGRRATAASPFRDLAGTPWPDPSADPHSPRPPGPAGPSGADRRRAERHGGRRGRVTARHARADHRRPDLAPAHGPARPRPTPLTTTRQSTHPAPAPTRTATSTAPPPPPHPPAGHRSAAHRTSRRSHQHP